MDAARVGSSGKPVAHPQAHSDPILWVPMGGNHLVHTPGPGLKVLGWEWVLLGHQTGDSSQRAVESELLPYV